MSRIFTLTQIIQKVQIIIQGKSSGTAQFMQNHLHLHTFLCVLLHGSNVLFKGLRICLLHGGMTKHMIEIFCTGSRLRMINQCKNSIHVQIIPGDIIQMELLTFFVFLQFLFKKAGNCL